MINRTIKGYEIKELVATGGMAAVYRATQVSTGRIVAIKVLHGHLAQDRDFVTRFEREARSAADLKHANIIKIIDYGETEGIYYIAMEYVDGKSLKDLINSVRFIPHDIALAIVYEICGGLEHAHQKGVVHRDIKPANILIDKTGNVKITDFGLAQAQDLTSITVTGAIVGTPAYMSPEQAAGRKIDIRSDIFSLGVVVYEMITGTKPFHGETYSSVIHAILTAPAAKPVEANPLVSEEISAVIEKMLQKDMDKRYQNVAQVNDAVYAYFRSQKIEVPSRQIGMFISEPQNVAQNMMQKAKDLHLKRGLYYLTLGKSNIDDAISELAKVQYLDPEDIQAKKHLAELRQKKKTDVQPRKAVATVTRKPNYAKIAGILGALLAVTIFAATLYRNYQNNRGAPRHHGILYAASEPSGAELYLDKSDTALMTPVKIDSLVAGEHMLQIKKKGYQPYNQSVEVKAGDSISVNALLVKETAAKTYGSLELNSKPAGAQVMIDGIDTELKTPCIIEKLSSGRHAISILKSGYRTGELTRNVEVGQVTSISISLTKIHSAEVRTITQKSYFKINVDPWAKIYIDGKYVETTPIAKPLEVSSGTRLVRLENPNYQTWQKRVDFKPGETKAMDIKLAALAGYLKISVRPWADVYIDGKFYETTPIAESIELAEGRHVLKLINPSFATHEEVINVVASETLRKSIELVPK
jgi:serine/threonine protein kinase